MVRPWLAAALVLASGCGRGGDGGVIVLSDYNLQLQPRVPENEDIFAGGASITLVVRTALGDTTLHYLGDAASGSVEATEMPVLEDVHLGVLVEEPGGEGQQYDKDLLLAYGETGPFTLGTDGAESTASVLLPAFAGVGELGTFGKTIVFPGVAALPNGDVYVFGGAKSTTATTSYDKVLRLADLHNGAWAFEEVGELPDFDGDGDADNLAGLTADAVVVDGKDMIFIAGGDTSATGNGVMNGGVALFDPEALEWHWVAPEWIQSKATTAKGRTHHVSVRMDNGNVLLLGGLVVENGQSYVDVINAELFDPTDLDDKSSGVITVSSALNMGFAYANLGAEGVLVCGGTTTIGYSGSTLVTEGSDECAIVSQLGDVRTVASLPTPAHLFAMSEVAGERVLATGGLVSAEQVTGRTDASNTAWVYDITNDVWDSISVTMNEARASHAMASLSDGRAVIIGGSGETYWDDTLPQSPVLCPEVFDPADYTFTVVEPCSAAGGGAEVRAVTVPGAGIFVGHGFDDSGGGDMFGIIGVPPRL